LELQSKLLRVLQEKEVERVGGKGIIKVDVRIVTATNRNLEIEVAEGRFRSDLYYRLNIFPIHLPPLRDRKADIPLLATHFVQRFAKKAGKKITSLSNKVINELLIYSWPGNIRELEHMMERSVLIATGNSIRELTLPTSSLKVPELVANDRLVKTLDENERDHIMKVLKQCQGKIGGNNGAAKLLGVPATTLSSKIKRLGIKRGFNI
jgi:formate hydrogenlyase transcriptional activator